MVSNPFFRLRQSCSNLGVLQGFIVVAALVTLLFVPPVNGQMMLVPLTADAMRGVAGIALQNTNKLVSTGSVDGSLIILGDRPSFIGSLLDHRVLIVAVPQSGCA